ncbi:MAG: hypothetical protein IPM29_32005 [Planctomycetes bacterium]|nr:hypothetical protein [Planctomycetota bacterium]
MLRPSFRALGLAAVAGLSLFAPATAQTQAPTNAFARALPADTLMYVSAPDLKTTLEEFQSMPLAKMWREKEVQDFFGRALAMADDAWGQMMSEARQAHENGQLPFDPDQLVKARIRAASFAITSMALAVPEGQREPLPRFGLVLHLDFGDTAPIWNQVLQMGMGMLQGMAGDEMTTSLRDVGGVQLTTMRPANEPIEMGINVAFVGNGVLIGTLEDDVAGMLQRLAGETAGGLTSTADFKAMARHVEFSGAETEVFLRPGRFIDFAMDTLRLAKENAPGFPEWLDVDGVERAVQALGLRSMQGIGATERYVDGKAVSSSFVMAPAADRRGFLTDTAGTIDLGFLRWIPKDAVSFSAMKIDVGNIYKTLTAALRAYDENMAEMMMGQLQDMESQLGLSLEKDLFGAFGNDLVYWSMPIAAMMAAPEMGIIVSVKDQEAVLRTLQTLANMSDGFVSLKQNERRGTWQLRFEFDAGGMMGGFNPADMFVPTFTFKDGYMVAGFTNGDVKRAVTRMEREDDPADDIRSNPEFAPFLAQIPKEGLSSLSFTDWKSSFEGMYSIVASAAMFLPMDESIPFEPELLPEQSTLTQHLYGGVTWSRVSPDGYSSSGVGPFGPEMFVILGGAVAAGIGVFAAMDGGADMPIRIR